ncbi:unnamed protein product [Trifolium pratense]|uniref:Uncharacterized protein n=1 Tax=Trifolium pratense TaxID=57577 RepID=A0ACB0J9K4_TRIPR|nr:unnamed protein product [Trifolium pratense]
MDHSSPQHSTTTTTTPTKTTQQEIELPPSTTTTTTPTPTTTTQQEIELPPSSTTTTTTPTPTTTTQQEIELPPSTTITTPTPTTTTQQEIELPPSSTTTTPTPTPTTTTQQEIELPPSSTTPTTTNSPPHSPPPTNSPPTSSFQQTTWTEREIVSAPTSSHTSSQEIVPAPTYSHDDTSSQQHSILEIQTFTENQPSGPPQSWMQRKCPYIFMLIVQVLFAVMNILMKLAINNGISNYVFVVYRNGVASLFMGPIGFFVDRNIRPAMTSRIFGKIVVLSLLGIILDQNLYYAGMKLTTATFATALSNTIPTITFVLAIIFRMEHLIIRNRPSQAKVVGTLVTLTGAMIMTLVKGPVLYGSGGANSHHHQGGGISLLGTVYLLLGCLSTASSTIFSCDRLSFHFTGPLMSSMGKCQKQ